MTVRELIEALRRHDPDKVVLVGAGDELPAHKTNADGLAPVQQVMLYSSKEVVLSADPDAN